jgi:glucosamine--fructose-6-phosphate aminotransferase (isomerizing)
MEKYGEVPVTVSISSEFHASKQFWEENTLYIFASQSGETADTISAIEFVLANKTQSSKILSILNYAHSSMSQKSDFVIQCFAGVEVGVASTKNFIAQAVIFYLLSVQHNKDFKSAIIAEIIALPQIMENLLKNGEFHNSIKNLAEQIIASKKVVYTGRTMLYPIACEGALKLSELSYLIVQPIPSGEFKHGPIAIVDNTSTIISLMHSQNLYSKTQSSNEEIRARNGNIVEISDSPSATISIAEAKKLPHTYPTLLTIAVQLISYYTSHKLGNDIDKPRNLAKSVTVE